MHSTHECRVFGACPYAISKGISGRLLRRNQQCQPTQLACKAADRSINAYYGAVSWIPRCERKQVEFSHVLNSSLIGQKAEPVWFED